MCLVARGSVRLCVAEVEVATLEAGAYFGADSLMADVPRTATVVAATEVGCVCVARRAIRDLLRAKATAGGDPSRSFRRRKASEYASYGRGLLERLGQCV